MTECRQIITPRYDPTREPRSPPYRQNPRARPPRRPRPLRNARRHPRPVGGHSPESQFLTASSETVHRTRNATAAPQDVLRDRLLAELQEKDPGVALTHLQRAVERAAVARPALRLASPGRSAGPPSPSTARTRAQAFARPGLRHLVRDRRRWRTHDSGHRLTARADRPAPILGTRTAGRRIRSRHDDTRPRPDPTQAVVLAGGQGSRLRPYTDDRPKPMVEIPGPGPRSSAISWPGWPPRASPTPSSPAAISPRSSRSGWTPPICRCASRPSSRRSRSAAAAA